MRRASATIKIAHFRGSVKARFYWANESASSPISADAENGSSEPTNQELVYQARVSLDRTQMQVEDRWVDLSSGMAVTVEIKTGSRRIISYLPSPLLKFKQEAMRER
jgi:hemolysin D